MMFVQEQKFYRHFSILPYVAFFSFKDNAYNSCTFCVHINLSALIMFVQEQKYYSIFMTL